MCVSVIGLATDCPQIYRSLATLQAA